MTKFSWLLLAAMISGTAANAGTISADMRVDYKSNTYDKASSSADNSEFILNTARVDAKGKLNEAVDYRFRFRLTSNRTVTTRDGLGADTDFAYLSNKFMDGLALTVGKFGSDTGGFEGATAGPDLYMTSRAYDVMGSFRYYTGAKLAYTLMEGHELAFHVANLDADNTGTGNNGTAGKFNQNKTMNGLVYKGSFMDKKLTAMASYGMQTGATALGTTAVGSTSDTDFKNTYIAAAVKYDADMYSVEADYISNKYGSKTTLNQDDSLDTMLIDAAYKMGQWTPRLKYESSIEKLKTSASAETKNTYTGTQLALEYKPAKDEMFRYHVAYWAKDTKTETAAASSTTTDKFVVVGTRILADFLK